MRRFSRTVSSMSSVSSWGTTPRRLRMRGPSVAGSMSRTRSVPSVTGETQPIMRMVEVFPAPLGPRNPKASPRPTEKSMLSTAPYEPKRLVRWRPCTRGGACMTATLPTGPRRRDANSTGGSRRMPTTLGPGTRSRVAVIPGDDAAPEAVHATLEVLRAMDLPIQWEVLPDGETLARELSRPERDRMLRETIDACDAALFGATSGKTG